MNTFRTQNSPWIRNGNREVSPSRIHISATEVLVLGSGTAVVDFPVTRNNVTEGTGRENREGSKVLVKRDRPNVDSNNSVSLNISGISWEVEAVPDTVDVSVLLDPGGNT